MSALAAQGAGITYHGRLLKPDGTPVISSSVVFRIQIRTPGMENCLLYEETQTKDLSASNGVFAIAVNDGSASPPNTEPFTLDRAFQNRGTFSFAAGKCSGATTYTPSSTDGRKLVVEFNDGSGWEAVPAQTINHVPMALESVTVGGFNAASLLRVVDGAGVPTVIAGLTQAQHNTLLDLVNGTSSLYRGGSANVPASSVSGNIPGNAAGFTGNLLGDVVGTQSATTVTKIQGFAVDAAAPSNGQALLWNALNSRWEPGKVAASTDWSAVTGKPSTFPSDWATTANKPTSFPSDWSTLTNIPATFAPSGHTHPVSQITSAAGVYFTYLPNNSACANGEVLKWETAGGGRWVCGADVGGAGDFMKDGSLAMTGSLKGYGPGTATSPAYAFAGSPGTGMYNPGTDQIGFSINGSEKIRIDSSGNVGIGTTTPQSRLDVNGVLRVPTICDETGANCKTISSGWGSGGSVTSVATGTGLTGGPITTTGTVSIAAGGVGATELATNAVTDVKIADNNVTTSKIADGNVTTAKIADGNVTGVKLETLAGLSTGTYGSATAIPAVTIDTKGRITAITTNTVTGLLPAASGASGKYLKSDGTNWSGSNVMFSDIKNSVGGSAFNLAGCAANQTVSWSSLTDMFTCQNIGSLDGAAITSGTIAAARLPAGASMWQDGGAGKIYYNGGNIGIGTSAPISRVHVAKDQPSSGYEDDLLVESFTNTQSPGILTRRARNTQAAPQALDAGDPLGTFAIWGYNGSDYQAGARLISYAETDFDVSPQANLQFWTNNGGGQAERMRISAAGDIGIGTTTPSQRLDVAGNIRARGQLSTGSQIISGGTAAINWDNGNTIRTDYNCASNISFANLQDGGTYTLIVIGAGTTQCNFSTATTGTDAGTVTYWFKPANGPRQAGSHTVYTFLRAGSSVYVSWSTGFL